MKQFILFPKRLVLLIDMSGRHLKCHVLVRDFGNVRNKEDGCETEDEDSDCQIDPLHALKGCDSIVRFGKEDVGAQDGADDSADGVEGLSKVDSNFCVAGGTADYGWARKRDASVKLSFLASEHLVL